jgi:hypothetical protein
MIQLYLRIKKSQNQHVGNVRNSIDLERLAILYVPPLSVPLTNSAEARKRNVVDNLLNHVRIV